MSEVFAGRFTLIDQIAHGDVGVVWRAWDRKKSGLCAVELVSHAYFDSIMQFVQVVGPGLEDPHLVAPYGWGADTERVAVAMPLVPGGPLDRLLRNHGAASPELVTVILSQILSGLGRAHDNGIVHGAITPGRILFAMSGPGTVWARLAGFSTAVYGDRSQGAWAASLASTRGYRAPEVVAEDEPMPASDLYSLGVIVALMCHGAIELHDGAYTTPEIDRLLARVPSELATVIRGMLAEDPNDRFASADHAKAALPYVSPNQPLTWADGTVVHVDSRLAPLDLSVYERADAGPAPVRAPEESTGSIERVGRRGATAPAAQPLPAQTGSPSQTARRDALAGAVAPLASEETDLEWSSASMSPHEVARDASAASHGRRRAHPVAAPGPSGEVSRRSATSSAASAAPAPAPVSGPGSTSERGAQGIDLVESSAPTAPQRPEREPEQFDDILNPAGPELESRESQSRVSPAVIAIGAAIAIATGVIASASLIRFL